MAANLSAPNKDKQLIVVSLPDEVYYRKSFKDVESFICQMSTKCDGLDDFLVVYSTAIEKRYKKESKTFLGANTRCLVVDESLDLWMRDFSPVLSKIQAKFRYQPKYLKTKDAKYIESQFMKFLGRMDIVCESNDVVLDGGNIVDNNENKAVVSGRILKENMDKSLQVLKGKLENIMGVKVAFIPDPDDTTGHADGVVAFVEEDLLLIGDYGDQKYYNSVEFAVKSAFPNVKTFRLPCREQDYSSSGDKKWRGFMTAKGSYVNMLVTNNAVYVPQYNQPANDLLALKVIRTHTKKTVVPVEMSKLSHMGGSVRCMSWHIDSAHPIAQALYKNSNLVNH